MGDLQFSSYTKARTREERARLLDRDWDSRSRSMAVGLPELGRA